MQRRHFLKTAGLSLALPMFESLSPAVASAAEAASPLLTDTGMPLRLAFLYVPNGVNVKHWTPEGDGADWKPGRTLEYVASHRSDFSIVGGLEHQAGYKFRDGAGDHARAMANFLTGARAKKTAGADIEVGVSVDQIAAQAMDGVTRLSSLELSCDGVRKSGSCDSGYSCAYQFNMAWRTSTQPVAPESNPRLAFERLFGNGSPGERQRNFAARQEGQKSMLDFLSAEAKTLQKSLGANDRLKLDEYLTGVREIEQQIQMAEHFGLPADPKVETPAGIPGDYAEHIQLMFDVMTLAFETDSTRICTFMLAHDGSNRSFQDVGVSDGHHDLSHHQDNEERLEKIARIDSFYIQQFAKFLDKMKAKKDADGKTLLENSMVVYGSGLSDGNRHSHRDLPVILAGKGGGKLNPGRYLKSESDRPMSNLYLTMLQRAGIGTESFSDSTGLIADV